MSRPHKFVIINADDFGRSSGINHGIIQAHEHGVITSASLMVRWPASAEAAAYARAHLGLSVGLHLDLGEWVCQDGEWHALYQVISDTDPGSVRTEIYRQLVAYRDLVGRDPTHIDSHQHFHMEEPARTIVAELAAKVGVPLRGCTRAVAYCGDFYGQTDTGESLRSLLTVDNLLHIVQSLPAQFTEVACHPAVNEDDLQSTYKHERLLEYDVVTDPNLKSQLADIRVELVSFNHSQLRAGGLA